jgi:predicted DCC family thiol-disulfide oxidoreductase YuxK
MAFATFAMVGGESTTCDLGWFMTIPLHAVHARTGFVNFIAENDSRQRIKFGAIQRHGSNLRALGAGRFAEGGSEALSTVVLAQGSTIYTKSSAAARALAMLDRPVCYVAGLIYIIPAPLRDVGYRIVAANRYRIFGRSETCRAPSPSFEQRFLEYEGTSTPKFLA